MKISDHFDLREFVDKKTYLRSGGGILKTMDKRLVPIMEKIRSLCGDRPITINNWHLGGKFQYRGYRPSDCPVGAVRSMHKFFKAVDFDVEGMTAEQVRGVIRLNKTELMKLGLTRIERGVNWVHIDTKDTGSDDLIEFNP